MQAVQHVKSNPLKNDVLSLAMPILICPACGAGVELKDSGVLVPRLRADLLTRPP